MNSLVEESRSQLEAQGEYVVTANADSGWFAIFPEKLNECVSEAVRRGRQGPNLVVYRTKLQVHRDHHVIPHSLLRDVLIQLTLTHSKVNGTTRWNITLKNGQLHVSHSGHSIDVTKFYGGSLITEQLSNWSMPEEIPESITYREGFAQRIVVNRYERDPRARIACIQHYGAVCAGCRMDFAKTYGQFMAGFIHVHHLIPISSIGSDYVIDPISDLRPVCPNCHAVIHRRDPPYTLEEVQMLIQIVE